MISFIFTLLFGYRSNFKGPHEKIYIRELSTNSLMSLDDDKILCLGVSNTERILLIFKIGAELQCPKSCMFRATNFCRIQLLYVSLILSLNK